VAPASGFENREKKSPTNKHDPENGASDLSYGDQAPPDGSTATSGGSESSSLL